MILTRFVVLTHRISKLRMRSLQYPHAMFWSGDSGPTQPACNFHHPGSSRLAWERFLWAEAQIHFTRAVGAAHLGNSALARQEVDKLADLKQRIASVKGD